MAQAARKSGKATRRKNRESGAIHLLNAGIAFTSKNCGAHLIVDSGNGLIDFWPGTELWKARTGKSGTGVISLCEHIQSHSVAKIQHKHA